ncbi:hypothetical protein DRO69_14290 [Candidatus Bathyarchaeota archaeon]|nr:MAG: hypothetical protein DRO69_14290 [Candidatus Bathyarchaeota archaeon]
MKEDEEELIPLKEIYEELWHDAKALAKDMKRSIMVYLYSAIVTFAVATLGVLYAIVYFMQISHGNASLFYYIGAIIEIVSSVVIIIFGAVLMRWYFKAKKKYSKLIEMAKTNED